MSDSLWPHGLQHTRLPCPSLPLRVCSNSCSLRWWCHPTILSYVAPFSSCLQSFPASGSFPMCQLFPSGSQRTEASASASVLPVNIQGYFLWGGGVNLLAVQEPLMSLLQYYIFKASILWCSAFFVVQLLHLYMATGKTIALTRQTTVSKVMSLLFNTLSRFVMAFLPRSKCLLISWLQSLFTGILEPKKIKSVTVSIFSPIYLPWSAAMCQVNTYHLKS